MTPNFIFFHGVAINTTNMLAGVIWHDNDDATKSRLYITTEHGGEQHALDVDYDTARDEWARVWTPQHETACACGSTPLVIKLNEQEQREFADLMKKHPPVMVPQSTMGRREYINIEPPRVLPSPCLYCNSTTECNFCKRKREAEAVPA